MFDVWDGFLRGEQSGSEDGEHEVGLKMTITYNSGVGHLPF